MQYMQALMHDMQPVNCVQHDRLVDWQKACVACFLLLLQKLCNESTQFPAQQNCAKHILFV